MFVEKKTEQDSSENTQEEDKKYAEKKNHGNKWKTFLSVKKIRFIVLDISSETEVCNNTRSFCTVLK